MSMGFGYTGAIMCRNTCRSLMDGANFLCHTAVDRVERDSAQASSVVFPYVQKTIRKLPQFPPSKKGKTIASYTYRNV